MTDEYMGPLPRLHAFICRAFHVNAICICQEVCVENKSLSAMCCCDVRCLYSQIVCITEPAIAMEILKSPHVDKVRFLYSFLDPVRDIHQSCALKVPSRRSLPAIALLTVRILTPSCCTM